MSDAKGSATPVPQSVAAAVSDLRRAFYDSVPFKRVANVNAAMDALCATISAELLLMRDDSLLAAAQICESRSRTLKSKPAQIEALQCGSAISTGGRRWLKRMREERKTTPSPDAGVAEHESVGATTTENA